MNFLLLGVFLTLVFTISDAQQTCTNGGVESANPLGTCGGCEDQFFMSQDCKTGFACHPESSSGPLDGCLLKCGEGEHILVNITTREWECVDETTNLCPGSVEFFCPDDSIPTEMEQVECGCDDWQVYVREDCVQATICHSAWPGGKAEITCTEGRTLDIDYANRRYICRVGDFCPPNMGGVVFGCPALPPPVPENSTEANCAYTTNGLGECGGCNQQIFINEECDQAFYCSTNAPEGQDGCSKQCNDGQVVSMDLYNRIWECKDRDSNYVCPGQLNTLCPEDEFTVQCECAGELWMVPDCQELYICDAAMDSNVFTGEKFTCPEGDMVVLDIANGNPFNYTCKDRTLQTSCPGAFHYGCNGDLPELTTTTTTPASTSTGAGDGSTTTMDGNNGNGVKTLSLTHSVILVCLLLAFIGL